MNWRLIPIALLVTLLTCSGRASDPYGPCRAAAACAEVSPLCVSFRNTATAGLISLCTRECATDAECPGNGVCIEIPMGAYRALCMERCTADSQCMFPGGFCAAVRPGDSACVP